MGEGMNIIEFAQKVSPVPLNMFQCKILEEYERAVRYSTNCLLSCESRTWCNIENY